MDSYNAVPPPASLYAVAPSSRSCRSSDPIVCESKSFSRPSTSKFRQPGIAPGTMADGRSVKSKPGRSNQKKPAGQPVGVQLTATHSSLEDLVDSSYQVSAAVPTIDNKLMGEIESPPPSQVPVPSSRLLSQAPSKGKDLGDGKGGVKSLLDQSSSAPVSEKETPQRSEPKLQQGDIMEGRYKRSSGSNILSAAEDVEARPQVSDTPASAASLCATSSSQSSYGSRSQKKVGLGFKLAANQRLSSHMASNSPASLDQSTQGSSGVVDSPTHSSTSAQSTSRKRVTEKSQPSSVGPKVPQSLLSQQLTEASAVGKTGLGSASSPVLGAQGGIFESLPGQPSPTQEIGFRHHTILSRNSQPSHPFSEPKNHLRSALGFPLVVACATHPVQSPASATSSNPAKLSSDLADSAASTNQPNKSSPVSFPLASARSSEDTLKASFKIMAVPREIKRPDPGMKREGPSQSPSNGSAPLGSSPLSASPGQLRRERKPVFADYLSAEEVSQGIKRGELFRATFRVNAHNRYEAYVTVEGVPVDALVFGGLSQNRAMEGDVVALQLDPPAKWPKMRGANKAQAESKQDDKTGGDRSEDELPVGSSNSDGGRSPGIASVISKNGVGSDLELEGPMRKLHLGESPAKGGGLGWKDLALSEGRKESSPGVEPEFQSGAESGSRLPEFSSRFSVGSFGGISNGLVPAGPLGVPDKTELRNVEDRKVGDSIQVRQAVARIVDALMLSPGKRPSGRVVAILEYSARRETMVGLLEIPEKKQKKIWPVEGSQGSPDLGELASGSGDAAQANGSKENLGKRKGAKGKANGKAAGGSSCGEETDSSQVTEGLVDGSILFVPADSRYPKMIVHISGLPDPIKKRLKIGDPTLATTLVAARVDSWRAHSYLPHAVVRQSLGQAGEIETETAAIMFQNNIHGTDFPDEALACLPKTPWRIPDHELKKRWDLRDCRITSIDPPTARDLDDALSIEPLPNGNFRVGVHIADVSYFVRPGTALDAEARRRSTSVYLIQRVLPMLPSLLCEQLCSLNPGVDRLAFSVLWEMTSQAEIVEQWLGRTVIRTCAKLAYGHAQEMIDGTFPEALKKQGSGTGATLSEEHILRSSFNGKEDIKASQEAREGPAEHPASKVDPSGTRPVLHGPHEWQEVVGDVVGLNNLARKLRAQRYANGAVKLDSCKLLFKLDDDGNPIGVRTYQSMESNHLVEEFMLLANMTVARAISAAFPEAALLRRHPEPNSRKLGEFEVWCEKQGFRFDSGSSGRIHESLVALREETKHDPALSEILLLHATKPMQLAKYFSTGELSGAEDRVMWAHYALATPYYTHFTSPIRRYPDLVVHRTLAAALEAEVILANGTAGSGKGLHPDGRKGHQADGGFTRVQSLSEPAGGVAKVNEFGLTKVPEVLLQAKGATSQAANGGTRVESTGSTGKRRRGRQGKGAASGTDAGDDNPDKGSNPILGVGSLSGTLAIRGSASTPTDAGGVWSPPRGDIQVPRCFTGAQSDAKAAGAAEARQAAAMAAKSHSLLGPEELADVAKHCNERKLASKSAQEASDKIYLCVMLKRSKGMLSDARVMALGPKFMTVYVRKFGIERSIFYEDMEGISAEWFESTGTLVLDLGPERGASEPKSDQVGSTKKKKGGKPGPLTKQTNRLGGGVAFAENGPSLDDMSEEDLEQALAAIWGGEDRGADPGGDGMEAGDGGGDDVGASEASGRSTRGSEQADVEPATLPLTLHMFSAVPVLVYTVGGGNKPMDVAVKLHVQSYAALLETA